MSRIIIFSGGTRSGKSAAAERYAALQGRPVVYLATAEAGDQEMAERIELHRRRRPAEWRTIEAPRQLAPLLRPLEPGTLVLLDCLTLLVSNLLFANQHDSWAAIERELDDLLAVVRERQLALVVVTSEVGLGIVPADALSRRYADLLGMAAQRIAAAAAEVYLVMMGLVVELRALQPAWARG